jgi:hypothetical protein
MNKVLHDKLTELYGSDYVEVLAPKMKTSKLNIGFILYGKEIADYCFISRLSAVTGIYRDELSQMLKAEHKQGTEDLTSKWQTLQAISRTKTMDWIKAKEQFKIKASIELAKQIDTLVEELQAIKIEMQEVVHQLTK